jgi:hypothetical protein
MLVLRRTCVHREDCVVFLCSVCLRPVSPVSLDCPFLITPSFLSKVYIYTIYMCTVV